ncbi:unnamed protein product [Dracunculus medinensis]|uniref:MARVEL domain-containing protein n=1 Tax=Dracunculus medinensis TaxID=318479 RepID=A0A158Q6B0_DRAME|nr:unnamed protein product [Dracunculus medinensis]
MEKTLEKSSCIEKKETNVELLTPAEFEQISVSEESDVEKSFRLPRRVHFSQLREIRHMPLSIADEAKQARLPYSGAQYLCEYLPRSFKYIFLLSIMWIISSVFLVTEYSISTYGALLALLSSFLYALYLVMFSYFQYQGLDIDINFLLGFVGVITLFLYAPVMLSLDYFKIEPLFPLPNFYQFSIIILNGVNNLFSDFLWLKGTIWTSSLASSISLSMCIPLSFIADTVSFLIFKNWSFD